MKRPPVLGILGALLAGLLAGTLVLRSGAAPEMTRESVAEARRLWSERGPASYSFELQMAGALTDRRRIEVRDGHVVAMSIDGEPASRTAWEYWSVDGLLDSLEAELRNAEDPPPGLGVSDPSQLVLRARFDRELGYPTEFLRHIMGSQRGTEWRVVSFEARK